MITYFVLAAVMLVAAVGVAATAAVAHPQKPEPCCTDGLTEVTPGRVPTGGGSTRPISSAPICMIGSWKASKEKMGAHSFWSNVGGTLTASGTHTYTLRPDGTMTESFANWAATGSAQGDTIKVTLSGSIEYTWRAIGDEFSLVEQTAADINIAWLQAGRKLNSRHVTETGLLDEHHKLSCQGTTMSESYDPSHTVTWTRTTEYGVY